MLSTINNRSVFCKIKVLLPLLIIICFINESKAQFVEHVLFGNCVADVNEFGYSDSGCNDGGDCHFIRWHITGDYTITYQESTVINVRWNTPGVFQVSAEYWSNSIAAGVSTESVTVEIFPTENVTLQGPDFSCTFVSSNRYTTEAGKSNYNWVITPSTGYTLLTGNP